MGYHHDGAGAGAGRTDGQHRGSPAMTTSTTPGSSSAFSGPASRSTVPHPSSSSFFPSTLPLPLGLAGPMAFSSGGGGGGYTRSRGIKGDGGRAVGRMGVEVGIGAAGTKGSTEVISGMNSGPGSSSRSSRAQAIATTAPAPSQSLARSTTTPSQSQSNSTSRSSPKTTPTISTTTTTPTPTPKNYRCTFEGCTKGFMTIPHMKRHLKSRTSVGWATGPWSPLQIILRNSCLPGPVLPRPPCRLGITTLRLSIL